MFFNLTHLQISDFGLAVTSGNIDKGSMNLSGTLGYVAPEYLLDGVASLSFSSLNTFVCHRWLDDQQGNSTSIMQLFSYHVNFREADREEWCIRFWNSSSWAVNGKEACREDESNSVPINCDMGTLHNLLWTYKFTIWNIQHWTIVITRFHETAWFPFII